MTALFDAATDRVVRADGAGRPRMRASDVDREAVVETLHDAVLRGLLTVEEGAERVMEAYATRFVDELPQLTADLPAAPPTDPVAPGWRAVASTAALQARMSLLGASSWSKADFARRRAVLVTAILLGILLVVLLTTAATSGGGDFGGGDWHHHHHHGYWDD